MPQFQLEIAIALAASVVVSLSEFYVTKTEEGKIQLPITREADGFDDEYDPFDVTTPLDIVDGFPVDGDKFWARVSCRDYDHLVLCV